MFLYQLDLMPMMLYQKHLIYYDHHLHYLIKTKKY
nr:MAG TPA: hypothetical protein [Caudoviricetes sp.]